MNIEMFLTAKEVEESLERQETATCLAWCHDNKSRLRKMKVVPFQHFLADVRASVIILSHL